MEMETRTCKKCGRTLPLSEFHKSGRSKDGLSFVCGRSKDGLSFVCEDCVKKTRKDKKLQKMENYNPLERFSSSELILELKRRGVRGEFIIQKKVSIDRITEFSHLEELL